MSLSQRLYDRPWLRLMAGVVFYLALTLLSAVYLTRQSYQDFVDGPLSEAYQMMWHDSAELGEQQETQAIFALQSATILNHLRQDNPLQVLADCQLIASQDRARGFALSFTLDLPGSRLSMNCRVQTVPWSGLALLAAMLTLVIGHYRPRPLARSERVWLDELVNSGLLLPGERTVWQRALYQFRRQHSAARIESGYLMARLKQAGQSQRGAEPSLLLQEAAHPLTLRFSCQDKQLSVTINQVLIPLSVTPAIYWLWYAVQRTRGDQSGWVSNPATNRPDPDRGAQLLELMQRFGGHGRAVSELQQHGLRAKTLDQNRNKIKEALSSVLGASLADSLAFENQRKAEAGSSCYRLKMSPKQIVFEFDVY